LNIGKQGVMSGALVLVKPGDGMASCKEREEDDVKIFSSLQSCTAGGRSLLGQVRRLVGAKIRARIKTVFRT